MNPISRQTVEAEDVYIYPELRPRGSYSMRPGIVTKVYDNGFDFMDSEGNIVTIPFSVMDFSQGILIKRKTKDLAATVENVTGDQGFCQRLKALIESEKE